MGARAGGIALLAILLLGVALRIYGLGTESIWTDEGTSIRAAHLSPARIIEESFVDANPPLYYLLLHYWVALLGDSEFSTRLLSAVFGSLALFMMYRVGSLLFGRSTGLLASLVLALSTFHIQYSQEARFYSLLTLLALLSFYFFIRLLVREERDSERVLLAGYISSTSLLAYAHVYGLFLIFAQSAYILVSFLVRRSSTGKTGLDLGTLTLAQGAVAVLYIPGFALLATQLSNPLSYNWVPETTADFVPRFLFAYSGSPAVHAPTLSILFVAPAFLSTLELLKDGDHEARHTVKGAGLSSTAKASLLWLWLLSPIVLPFVISKISTPMLVERYTIAASLPFFLLVAQGMERVNSGWSRRAIGASLTLLTAAVIIALSLVNTREYFVSVDKPQWREAVSYVDANAEPEDLVVVYPDYDLSDVFDYYSERTDIDKASLPGGPSAVTEGGTDTLRRATEGHDSVWLLLAAESGDSGERLKEELGKSYALAYSREYNLIEMTLWSKREQ